MNETRSRTHLIAGEIRFSPCIAGATEERQPINASNRVHSFTRPTSSPSPTQGADPASKARPLAIASLVLSVAWIAGVGSILGIILGFVDLRGVKGGSNFKVGSRLAVAGIIVGIVGMVLTAIVWSSMATNSAANAILNSPAYIGGSAFASSNFSTTVRESSVCTPAHARA